MFTLEAVTTKFVQNPVKELELESIGLSIGSQAEPPYRVSKRKPFSELGDEGEEKKVTKSVFLHDSRDKDPKISGLQQYQRRHKKIKDHSEEDSNEHRKTSVPAVEDQSQSEQDLESYKRETFGSRDANLQPQNQSLLRMEQGQEPDHESTYLSNFGHQKDSKASGKKSAVEDLKNTRKVNGSKAILKKNTLLKQAPDPRHVKKESESFNNNSMGIDQTHIQDLDSSHVGMLNAYSNGVKEESKEKNGLAVSPQSPSFMPINDSK